MLQNIYHNVQMYPYRVGDHMPDKIAIHLPSMLSRKSVYERMKQERAECASLVSQSQFYALWSQNYPRVTIPAVSSLLYKGHSC